MREGCERARQLIERDTVEGVDAAERAWLDGHLEECAECAEAGRLTAEAVRTVRAASVHLPEDLAFRTRYRVSLRAQELRGPRRGWALWVSLALSWAVGIASAPLVWRFFDWVGQSAGLPPIAATLACGLWWTAPAAIAGTLWILDRKRVEEE
jgi:hypothetical protein